MGTSRKRTWPSGRVTWTACWRDANGKRRFKDFELEREANDHWIKMEADVSRGTYIDPKAGQQTFGQFADEEWAPAQDWKASTRETWENTRKRLEWAGITETRLARIDRLALQTFRQKIRGRYAHETTKNTMGWISMVLGAAQVNGRIAKNPADGLGQLKARAGEHDGIVTPDMVPTTVEALAILNGAPVPWRAAVALGLTGLRRGEILGLSSDRIDIDRRLITVDRQLARVNSRTLLTTPKNEKKRTIKVPPQVAFEIRRHLRDHHDPARVFEGNIDLGAGEPGALLFQGRRGTTPCVNPQDFYKAAWRPALVGAGLDDHRFKPHALRHFAASSMLAEGASITAVAGHLGDTVETISRTYAHWLRDDRDVPAEILERVLAPEVEAAEAR